MVDEPEQLTNSQETPYSDEEIGAALKLFMPPSHYRRLLHKLTEALAFDAGATLPLPEHQHEADVDEAKWMLAVLYVAGYAPRPLLVLEATLDEPIPA